MRSERVWCLWSQRSRSLPVSPWAQPACRGARCCPHCSAAAPLPSAPSCSTCDCRARSSPFSRGRAGAQRHRVSGAAAQPARRAVRAGCFRRCCCGCRQRNRAWAERRGRLAHSSRRITRRARRDPAGAAHRAAVRSRARFPHSFAGRRHRGCLLQRGDPAPAHARRRGEFPLRGFLDDGQSDRSYLAHVRSAVSLHCARVHSAPRHGPDRSTSSRRARRPRCIWARVWDG